MKEWKWVGAAVAALVLTFGGPVEAQVTVGARLGWNLSNLRDVDGLDANRETAGVGGAYVNFGGTLSFQPELLLSKREASLTNGAETGAFSQNFVEIPLLVLWRPAEGVLQPGFYGGASVSFETDCDTDWSSVPDGPGGCSGFLGADTDAVSYGGIVGAVLEMALGPLIVGLDARYNHGLSDLAPGSDVRWSYWSLGLQAGLGLGR